jgi:hypothetical protein
VDVEWTTDTGTTRSIISKKIFERIPKKSRPELEYSCSLKGVNGEPLKELGKTIFKIQLGPETIIEELIAADIEDEALLGLDILAKEENGPDKLNLNENFITVRGQNIRIRNIQNRIRKVSTVDSIVIPPYSEALVGVFIDRSEVDQTLPHQIFCVEPSEHFNRFPLLMASCLVDLENKVASKVRVLNPLKTEISLRQGEILGDAELMDSGNIQTIMSAESFTDQSDHSIRRIQLGGNFDKGDNSDQGKLCGPTDGVVPKHLLDLYDRSICGKTVDEKQDILDLLCKYQTTFSRNDSDLGITSFIQHEIDTGDAKRIRQPPRRVPLAFAEEEQKVVKNMLEQGIIRKSSSPWASPIVLVKKKYGKTRCCIDY